MKIFVLVFLFALGCSKTNSKEEIKAYQAATDAYCSCVQTALKTTPKTHKTMMAAKEKCEPAYKKASKFKLSVPPGLDPAAGASSKLISACFTMMFENIPKS